MLYQFSMTALKVMHIYSAKRYFPLCVDRYNHSSNLIFKTRLFQIPSAIVYGENDQTIGPVSTKNLKNLPNSKLNMIKGAGHAAWIDKPEEFHLILYKFLLSLSSDN